MVMHVQIWVEPASKVFDLVARFYLGATYFNIHSLQFIKLLASSNNNELSLIVIDKESVVAQPAPDLLDQPNEFHSKYMCFGSWMTHEDWKICLKMWLFGFRDVLVTRSTTMSACRVVSSSTPIGPFEFAYTLKFNGCPQGGFILNFDWSIWICTQIQMD